MCVFCRIIKGDLPAYKVYEDERILAFLDINPVSPGHVLVIPKAHVEDIESAGSEDIAAIALVIKEIGRRLREKLACPAYNVSQNNGTAAGQEVPHLHFHLIPRYEGDGLKTWPQRPYQPGEAEAVLAKLKD